MTFTAHIEHQTTDGERILDEFEGVTSVMNPTMTSSLRLQFSDDREDKKLRYGTLVTAKETNDD